MKKSVTKSNQYYCNNAKDFRLFYTEKSCRTDRRQLLYRYSFQLFNVLKSVVALLAGTDFYNILNVINKDFSVADVTGIKNLFRCFDNASDRNLAYNNVKLNLRKERRLNLNAAVELRLALCWG